jgi:hypothetical protein
MFVCSFWTTLDRHSKERVRGNSPRIVSRLDFVALLLGSRGRYDSVPERELPDDFLGDAPQGL